MNKQRGVERLLFALLISIVLNIGLMLLADLIRMQKLTIPVVKTSVNIFFMPAPIFATWLVPGLPGHNLAQGVFALGASIVFYAIVVWAIWTVCTHLTSRLSSHSPV